MKRSSRKQKGSALVGYVLLVSLILIPCIGAVNYFSLQANKKLCKGAYGIEGKPGYYNSSTNSCCPCAPEKPFCPC